jgi:hypothetical protein
MPVNNLSNAHARHTRIVPLPLSAADAAFFGTWKMRPSGVPGDTSKQVQTITQVGDGAKVNTESRSYTTNLDGADVPV